jgi:hypothetical protein
MAGGMSRYHRRLPKLGEGEGDSWASPFAGASNTDWSQVPTDEIPTHSTIQIRGIAGERMAQVPAIPTQGARGNSPLQMIETLLRGVQRQRRTNKDLQRTGMDAIRHRSRRLNQDIHHRICSAPGYPSLMRSARTCGS